MVHIDPIEPDAPRRRRRRDRQPSPEAQLAADLLGYALAIPSAEILSDTRGNPGAASARQVAMYLLYTACEMSQPQIAAALARDRATVSYGLRVVEDRRDDPRFDAWLQQLEDTLRCAPAPLPDAREVR